MFIYKITVLPLNQVYIGLDTNPSYKLKRWRAHCQNAIKGVESKLYNAMRKYGIANCKIEVLMDNVNSIGALALSEIEYIKKYKSYTNGLNSTTGGDGLSNYLHQLTESEIAQVKSALGTNLRNYNKNKKWANTTPEDRKELTKHLHTQKIYKQKSETLKQYYKANPDKKIKKRDGVMAWQKENREKLLENNKKNSAKGAAKVSVAITVELSDGTVLQYPSKSEFNRQTGQWAKTIIDKTAKGKTHNGYKAWET